MFKSIRKELKLYSAEVREMKTINRMIILLIVLILSIGPTILCNSIEQLSDKAEELSNKPTALASIEPVSTSFVSAAMSSNYERKVINKSHITEEYIETAADIHLKEREEAARLQAQLEAEQAAIQAQIDATTAYASTSVISYYEGYITKYMDLQNRVNITTDQMNVIIDYWLDINGRNSAINGLGQAFIDAAKTTGYDPIFLLALCAVESGWGSNQMHIDKSNPYSINMTDENPYGGYLLGDNFYDGIVNGAKWIWDHYYMQGQTTLYDMIYGSKMYCSNGDHWISLIVNIMSESYKIMGY